MSVYSDELVMMLINSGLAIVAIFGLIFSFYWNRRTLDEMKKQRLTTIRPILSQKIGIEDKSVGQHHSIHFMLKVKNYGSGVAFNQSFIDYKFYHNNELLVNRKAGPMMGAYDDLEPLVERPLDLSRNFKDDWAYDYKGIKVDGVHCNFVEIRLPYEDIQGNKCCSCTKYVYNEAIIGRYGKIERYN